MGPDDPTVRRPLRAPKCSTWLAGVIPAQARIESELPEGAPSQLAGDAQLRLRTRCVQARSWAPPGALSMGRGYAAKPRVKPSPPCHPSPSMHVLSCFSWLLR